MVTFCAYFSSHSELPVGLKYHRTSVYGTVYKYVLCWLDKPKWNTVHVQQPKIEILPVLTRCFKFMFNFQKTSGNKCYQLDVTIKFRNFDSFSVSPSLYTGPCSKSIAQETATSSAILANFENPLYEILSINMPLSLYM